MENPYSSPQAPTGAESDVLRATRHYGGIRRLPYLGIVIGMGILQNGLQRSMSFVDGTGSGNLIVTIVFLIASFFPVYYRLKNIGMNPWWCLAMLVPLLNLLVGVRCLVFQEGYADTKKLDRAGKITSVIVLMLFILIVGAIIVSVTSLR